MGPDQNGLRGAGRVNCLTFNPWNSSIIYIGTAGGGVWKSINGGANWDMLNTDHQLARLGISSIIIDPVSNDHNNPIMYVATGDVDGGFYFSDGVYRSIDGGVNWRSINSNFISVSSGNHFVTDIIIDPNSSDLMYASTTLGIYKCLDRRSNNPHWQKIYPISGNQPFYSIGALSINSNTELFASGKDILISSDQGVNWQHMGSPTSGLDLSNTPQLTQYPGEFIQRIKLQSKISPTGGFDVYALIITSTSINPIWSDSYYNRFYKYSSNQGLWVEKSYMYLTATGANRPTIDRMVFKVSEVDDNIILAGNFTQYRSLNNGDSWSSFASCAHVDYHDIEFEPGSNDVIHWVCTDGGVYRIVQNPYSCVEMNTGLSINQINGLATSSDEPIKILAGLFDNGMRYYDGASWITPNQNLNDIFETQICQDEDTKMVGTGYGYCSSGSGCLHYSFNSSVVPSFSCCSNTNAQNALFDAMENLKQDPINPERLYQGRRPDLWRSDNFSQTGSSSWVRLSDFSASHTVDLNSSVTALAVSPTHPNFIYLALTPIVSINQSARLFVTTVGGGVNNWLEITPSGIGLLWINSIVVSELDPAIIWVVFSGYDNSNKVKKYDGNNWINYGDGLPNVPMNMIRYEKGTNDGLYLATDIGVYYRNAASTQWEPFMQGPNGTSSLPNVIVRNIDINYTLNKIFVGTYGRGVWSSRLSCPMINYLELQRTVNTDVFNEVKDYIKTSESISVSVSARYRAGQYILLEPGFETNDSELFYAYIHKCDDSGNSFKVLKDRDTINERSPNNDKYYFVVYPNPVRTNVIVEYADQIDFFKKEQEKLEIDVYNIIGERVGFYRAVSVPYNFDITHFSSGIYILIMKLRDRVERHLIQKI